MIAFWIAALAVTALAAVLMFALSRRPVAVMADPAQSVYRRQLSELDNLAERGLLGEDERKSAYAEAARRLLSEPGSTVERAEDPKGMLVASVVIALVGVAAVTTYVVVGKPHIPDQPYASRLEAWQAQDPMTLTSEQLLALAERVPEERRNDPELLGLVARLEAQTGDLLSAQRSLERRLAAVPDDAEGWFMLAEIRMALNGGKVTPPARAALRRVLEINPGSLDARYVLARDAIDSGRRDEGLSELRALREEAPAEVRERLDTEIATVERGGGLSPGSAAAADPAILAMVEGLAARLETNPDDPDGWARLIRSYQVMGDLVARDAALDRAREVFKGRPRDLALVDQAANVPQ